MLDLVIVIGVFVFVPLSCVLLRVNLVELLVNERMERCDGGFQFWEAISGSYKPPENG